MSRDLDLGGGRTAFLDCGIPELGFARLRCPDWRRELFVTFSCKTRGFCPSCLAKRAALGTEWLLDEVLLPVRHHQWVFTLPKRIRPFFLYDRSLLGDLARCAFRTVQQLSRRRATELGLDADGLPSASSASNTAAPTSPAPTPDAAPIHAPAP